MIDLQSMIVSMAINSIRLEPSGEVKDNRDDLFHLKLFSSFLLIEILVCDPMSVKIL